MVCTFSGESGESFPVEVYSQWSDGGDEDIDSDIEFESVDEEWVVDVLLYDFSGGIFIKFVGVVD